MPPEESQPKPALDKPSKPARQAIPFKFMLVNGLITLGELTLPTLLALVLIFVLARLTNLGAYSSQLLAAMFMLFLVLITLILAIILTSMAGSIRGDSTLTGDERIIAFRWRFVKLIAAGLVVPVVVGVLAITQEFSPGVTYLSQGLRFAKTAAISTPITQVTDAVIKSKSSPTKLQGIRMLAGTRSALNLEQLLRIVQEDKTALTDPAVAKALEKAIAAYNLEAKQQLLTIFLNNSDAAKNVPSGLPDAYTAYFAADFESLAEEVRQQVSDPQLRSEQLTRLEILQAQLKSGLEGLDLRLASANPAGRSAYFCLQTFLAMEVREDNDILILAKKTAADSSFPDRLRILAFQLVGKMGGSPEVNWLYPYLQGGSETLRAAALSALADLQDKGKPAESAPAKK